MKRIFPLSPAPGSITAPLQAYAWTGFKTHPRDPLHLRHPSSGTHTFDRSLPASVRFAWQDPTAPRALRYRVLLSRHADLAEPEAFAADATTTLDVPGLHVDTTYWWKVTREPADAKSDSAVHSFRTHALLPRWIHVPGITNVRDLGGWRLRGNKRIRQGLVYRSSEMNGHLTIHPAGCRVLEDVLRIRTDLDLRGEGEELRPVLDPARVRWVQVPIRPYGEMIRDIHHAGYRQIFELFADRANYPILFHCWGGADRAGTVAYLLHAILDGYAEHLARDYELTTMAVWEQRLRTQSGYRALLSTLDAFGNGDDSPRAQAEHFLKSIGVSQQVMRAIRRILIEPAG